MKKLLILFLSVIMMFYISGCSNKSEQLTADNLNHVCFEEIQNIEEIENLNDETIKALSVIVRTNIKNGYKSENKTREVPLSEPQTKRIKGLINYTSNQVLADTNIADNFDNSNNSGIQSKITYFVCNNQNTLWSKEIKKHELLSFLNKQGISLASLSSLSFSSNDDGRVTELTIGGKVLPFSVFAEEFKLESDKITNVTSSLSSFVIEGIGKGFAKDINVCEIDNKNAELGSYFDLINKLFPKKTIILDENF